MSRIRTVVVSDLHLGQDQSLFTHIENLCIDPSRPSPLLKAWMDCLADLLSDTPADARPTLVLLGDVFELALTEMHHSFMAFERFAELWVHNEQNLFGELIYVPGNHDHHMWARARESAYLDYLRDTKSSASLRPVLHTTGLTEALNGNAFMQAMLQRTLGKHQIPIRVHYPSLAIPSSSGRKMALLDHGHYFERLYHLMNTLEQLAFPECKDPTSIEALERDNFAWIDFFWSMMGRQGRVGHDVERIYDQISVPRQKAALADTIVKSLLEKWSAPTIEKRAAQEILVPLVNHHLDAVAETERSYAPELMSKRLQTSMKTYVEKLLFPRVRSEIGPIPDELLLIFGHTHKPFEAPMRFQGVDRPVELYNTGGWVVDPSDHPQPLHGGAMVLLNTDLDAVSLRFFNEGHADIRVQQVGASTPFSDHIRKRVTTGQDPYRRFSDLIPKEIAVREQVLAKAIAGGNTKTQ